MIRLEIPGLLRYRDVALRVVGSGCRLLAPSERIVESMVDEVVSAVGEAFNNVVLHGYGIPSMNPGGRPTEDVDGAGVVTLELDTELRGGASWLVVRMRDDGRVFDPHAARPAPEALPERGMGLHIIRAFVDEFDYVAGPPNVLVLRKRFALQPADDVAQPPLGQASSTSVDAAT